jgi:hypothetical protein
MLVMLGRLASSLSTGQVAICVVASGRKESTGVFPVWFRLLAMFPRSGIPDLVIKNIAFVRRRVRYIGLKRSSGYAENPSAGKATPSVHFLICQKLSLV